MKKAQMEILGLSVVIILIILGMMFYIKFSNSKSLDKENIEIPKLEQSLLDSMLKTTVNCIDAEPNSRKYTVSELLHNQFSTQKENLCDEPTSFPTKSIARERLGTMLNLTLKTWGAKYYLIVSSKTSLNPIIISSDSIKCNLDTQGPAPAIQISHLRPNGNMNVILRICPENQ